ncbi:hypothetical protein ACFSHT_22235 [Paraburkholderia silviterrae]|uniref:hypothetical protein n=1 Tax=Paraburkholderia silviterrae TaxID=2528715 RepID=UPI0014050073|nr:hypothetical protein [Paraburkholderia silviterrae]
MKDFGQWFNDQRPAEKTRANHEDDLQEDGTAWQMADGTWQVRCCCCDEDFELPVDTMEVVCGQEFYCGGSERCCP